MRARWPALLLALLVVQAAAGARAQERAAGQHETWQGRPSTSPRWTVYPTPPAPSSRPRRPLSAEPVPGMTRPAPVAPGQDVPGDVPAPAGGTWQPQVSSELPRYGRSDSEAGAIGVDAPPPPMPTFVDPVYRREEPSKEPQPLEPPSAGVGLQLPGAKPAQ